MSSNWWINKAGKISLYNLSDEFVLDFLHRYPLARKHFDSAVEQMDEDGKERFRLLMEQFPMAKTRIMRDPRDLADDLQSRMNKAGVSRVSKRRKK